MSKRENGFTWFFALLIACILMTTVVSAGEVVFEETFENYTLPDGYSVAMGGKWQHTGRGDGTLVEVSETVAQSGKKSILLYDNDPKQAATLDAKIKFPQSGSVTGYLMIPSVCKGAKNSGRGYTTVQLFSEGKGGPVIIVSFRRATKDGRITTRMDEAASLPDVIEDDTWLKWQIEWKWDGASSSGKFRVTIGDKQTNFITYDNGKLRILRLVSGWSGAMNNGIYYDSIRMEAIE